MTRVNAGVEPITLTREHLIAEHREIKRIPNAVRQGRVRLENIPESFRLGTGHVKFFYDKLGYLRDRYISIRNECWRRNYQVTDYVEAWEGIPEALMGQWDPTPQAIALVQERIQERLTT